jgi:hypothetical protein
MFGKDEIPFSTIGCIAMRYGELFDIVLNTTANGLMVEITRTKS